VSAIAKSTIMEKIFPKNIKACHAVVIIYPPDEDLILQVLSEMTVSILSEFEFCIRCISSVFKKLGIRLVFSMYQGTHS
jgi:hypothetical protein